MWAAAVRWQGVAASQFSSRLVRVLLRISGVAGLCVRESHVRAACLSMAPGVHAASKHSLFGAEKEIMSKRFMVSGIVIFRVKLHITALAYTCYVLRALIVFYGG